MRGLTGQSIQAPSLHKFFSAMAVLMLMAVLSGCGQSEPQQRKAFIGFLKGRIVDKPGIHLPVPAGEERKSWGAYAAQFDVIADFNRALDEASGKALGDFGTLAASARSISALMGLKSEAVRIRDAASGFQETIKRRLEIANAARAAFPPQPDDLKAVYDAAYQRDVSGPAGFWIEAMPAMRQAMTSYLAVIEFIEQHEKAVTVSGSMVTANDPKLVPRLNELIKEMNRSAAKSAALFNRAQKLTYGN